MDSASRIVIVGAGMAGAKLAEALREQGFDGRLILLGDEAERPYDRPPLSKGYLLGNAGLDEVFIHPAGFYEEHQIELRLDTTVIEIDRSAREVVIAGGERLAYDRLALTTGSSPRPLAVPGTELAGVCYLRRLGDSDALKAAYAGAGSVVVIGAGWIGLETAAAARAAGAEVAVVEAAPLPLHRVLGPELGEFYAGVHRDHGVSLYLGAGVEEITGAGGRADGVTLTRGAGGAHLAADLVVVGVGIQPNTGLAAAAGLAVDDGVVVDEHLASSDPDIFALGDVASTFYPFLGRHLRLEHWSAAYEQPAVAAANMLGNPTEYGKLPYFFSDQYEVGMEYTGYAPRYDQVVFRGDPTAGEFIAFWLGEGRVLAGMNVNVWEVTGEIEVLIRSRAKLDPARLADPAVALGDLAVPGG